MQTHRSVALFVCSFLLSCAACQTAEDTAAVQEQTHTLQLGETAVQAAVYETGRAGPVFVNLHDDENTSVEAAHKVLAEMGGRLIELRHSGARNLTFLHNDSTFVIDPNRIFTDAGAAATLANLSTASPAALAATRQFAEALLDLYQLTEGITVIALHNNTDERYSTTSYLGDGPYVGDAAEAVHHPGSDADDFFFITEKGLYDALAGTYNAVLQNNAAVTDDGSLSVYCGQQGVRYVNVEAEHGHLDVQVEMIRALAPHVQ